MEIIIAEKPEYVTFDEIHDVLWAAHETTRAQGMYFDTAAMTGKELQSYLEKNNGICYVALDGKKVVGTDVCFLHKVTTGVIQGCFAKSVLVAILPEYKGHHIFSRLFEKEVEYAKMKGADGIESTTFADNHKVRQIREKQGFVYTRFYRRGDHFSVAGYLCLNGFAHGKQYYQTVFFIQKMKAYIKYFIKKMFKRD